MTRILVTLLKFAQDLIQLDLRYFSSSVQEACEEIGNAVFTNLSSKAPNNQHVLVNSVKDILFVLCIDALSRSINYIHIFIHILQSVKVLNVIHNIKLTI
jgi:hypothetical protein